MFSAVILSKLNPLVNEYPKLTPIEYVEDIVITPGTFTGYASLYLGTPPRLIVSGPISFSDCLAST